MRSDEFRKEAVVSIRMSRQQKERMKQNAQKNGKSLSEYLVDCGMAGLEKQRCRDRKKMAHMIRVQEDLNKIYNLLSGMSGAEVDLYRKEIDNLAEEEKRIWECL